MTNSTTKDALADAFAGVSGSLVAMLTFYPIDVLKTNLQADKSNNKTSHDDEKENEEGALQKISRNKQSINYNSIRKHLLTLFRGLHYKTAHTVASSFAYFFLYSWLQSKHKLYLRQKHHSINQSNSRTSQFQYQPSTSARLLVSAIAAMMNTALTLPLDVLAARSQTHNQKENADEKKKVYEQRHKQDQLLQTQPPPTSSSSHSKSPMKQIMDQIWEEKTEDEYDTAEEEGDETRKEIYFSKHSESFPTNCDDHFGEELNNNDGEEKKYEKEDISLQPYEKYKNENENDKNQTKPILRINSASSLPIYQRPTKADTNKKSKANDEDTVLDGFWKSLWPSLLLCSNPSIHFTVFETVKESLFKYRSQNNDGVATSSSLEKMRLSMGEAFVIGIVAKFAATIATYPLIRAKVMLMVSQKAVVNNNNNNDDDESKQDQSRKNQQGANTNGKRDDNNDRNATMIGLLRTIFATEGVNGLYKGCSLQLVHTLLKSALLMMVRERITVITRSLLLGEKSV